MTEDAFQYDPLSIEAQDDPYPYYRELLDSRPVYHNTDRSFWALSRYQDVRRALKDWKTYSSARGVNIEENFMDVTGPEILNLDPPRHDELRAVVRHAFTPKKVAGYADMVTRYAEQLLGPILDEGGGDAAADFSQRLPILVICELLGIPVEDEPIVRSLAGTMLLRDPETRQTPPEGVAAAKEMREYLGELVAARRAEPRDDVMTALATGEVDGKGLAPEEIFGMLIILYLAGNTTTSSLISNGMLVLAQHPDQRDRLAADPQAISDAIEELLRYESPVQYSSRVTTVPVEVHGEEIPAGERVVMLVGAANRDRSRWEDADALDLFRPVKRNLAFGEGIHFCIGAPLARLEGRIAFELILTRMPGYRVSGPIKRMYLSTERGLASLPVEVGQ